MGLAAGQEAPPEGEASLLEPRAWKGVIEASGRNVGKEITRGEEVQRERVEFLLVTEPPRTTIGWPRLAFKLREGRGSYELSTDVLEGEGEGAIASRGDAAGDLYPVFDGYVEPTTGKYKLTMDVTPATIAVVGTVSGVVEGKFVNYRTAGRRAPFLSGFGMEGDVGEEGRVISGSRKFTDRRSGVVREAEVTWRIERLDAAVRGRVADHLGRPVAGMKVLARHIDGNRMRQRLPPLLREGKTDAEGRFRIDAFHGPWTVQLVGEEREGLVLAGRMVEGVTEIRFDDVPDPDLKIEIYRLDLLPQPHLLPRHFQGDADAYLSHIRARAPAEVFERALEEAEGAPAAGE
jgi:hypothetical protein